MKTAFNIVILSAVLSVIVLLPASREAAAQDNETITPEGSEAEDQAKAHFEQGVKYFNEEDWEKALKEFQKSFNIKPHWKIRYNIGLCYLKLEFWAQSMTEMTLMLEEGGENVSSKQANKVKSMIDLLTDKVGALTLEGDVENAEVFVDGKPIIGLARGGVLFLNPGEHRVEVRLGSKTIISEDVVLRGGQEKVLDVNIPEEMIPPGEGQEIHGGGEETPVEQPVPAPPTPKKNRAIIIAGSLLAALAGAALVGGAASGINAIIQKGKQEDAKNAFESGQETSLEKTKALIDEHYGKASGSATASTILFSVGGGLAAASLIVFLIPKMKKEKKQAASHLESIEVLPGPASLTLTWPF